MAAPDAGGVWVTTGDIYAKLLEVEDKVDELRTSWREQQLPARVRSLELWRYAVPANVVITLAGLAGLAAKS